MTLEEWQNIYNQLDEWRDDFIVRRNKSRNDFRYEKYFLENQKEKDNIVYNAVQLIRRHSELFDMLIEDEPESKEFYEGSAIYRNSEFLTYSFRLLDKIQRKIDFLSEED